MSLLKHAIVPMPESKVTFNSSNKYNISYVYYTKRAYRNAKNQPTSDKVLIGRKDTETGMLIPNKNYYDIFNENEIIYTKSILDYGTFYLMKSVFNELGLTNILKNVFPGSYKNIMDISLYMLCEGNVLFYCDDWCAETYTVSGPILTSQFSSKLFESITYDHRMKFFKSWAKLHSSNEYIAYDVTSFSSYAQENGDLELGYNRDKEKLPQFNLGMYYAETSKLPIYYCIYPGSILDKSHLKYMMQDNEMLGIKNVMFVMDMGFLDVVNYKYMESKGHFFTICVSNSLDASKEILSRYRDNLNSSRYYDKVHDIYADSENTQGYSVNANINIYFDPERALFQENDLYRRVSIMEDNLSKIKSPLSKKQLKDHEKYFDITDLGDGNISYKKNYEKIDDEKANSGFFLLLTTDTRKGPSETLEIYRRKDLIEKCFDDLKNSIDMKRIRCYAKMTTDGKMFVAFISLILKSHMMNKLSKYFNENNSSIEKVLKEIRKIKVVTTQEGLKMMNPMTKKQKEILSYFGIKEKDVTDYIISCK